MRTTMTLTIAATAFLAAAPAIAQNTGEQTNTTDVTATNTTDVNAVTANDMTAVPATNETVATDTTTTTEDVGATAPAPEDKSFPWGVVGLIGLLGLIPRFRRNR